MPYCYHPLIHEKILKGKIPKDEIHNFYKLFEIWFNPISKINNFHPEKHQQKNNQSFSRKSTDSNSLKDIAEKDILYKFK